MESEHIKLIKASQNGDIETVKNIIESKKANINCKGIAIRYS